LVSASFLEHTGTKVHFVALKSYWLLCLQPGLILPFLQLPRKCIYMLWMGLCIHH